MEWVLREHRSIRHSPLALKHCTYMCIYRLLLPSRTSGKIIIAKFHIGADGVEKFQGRDLYFLGYSGFEYFIVRYYRKNLARSRFRYIMHIVSRINSTKYSCKEWCRRMRRAQPVTLTLPHRARVYYEENTRRRLF